MLKDSGARREFGTGAVRDISENKGRCDLLPLDVLAMMEIEGHRGQIFSCISGYIQNGNIHSLIDAVRIFYLSEMEVNMYTAILEVAIQYEEGAKKYSERNWEAGIPLHCFIDSGIRHLLKYFRDDADEPHDRAFLWNMLGAIWMHKNRPEMIDLPFAEKEKPKS